MSEHLILEIDNNVHHDQSLGWQNVLGTFSASLQPRLKRLVCPANTLILSIQWSYKVHTIPSGMQRLF